MLLKKINFLVCKCGDFEPHKKFVKTLTSVKLCSSNRLNRKMHEQLLRFSINSQLENPLGLLWLFRPSTAHITTRYTTTSITFKHAVVEKLEQSWTTVYTEYCQNRGQKKPAGKNPNREKNSAGNLSRTRGSCCEKPILRRLHGWSCQILFQFL